MLRIQKISTLAVAVILFTGMMIFPGWAQETDTATDVMNGSPFEETTPTPEPVDEPPVVDREFRAFWVATVANIDWPSRKGLPVEEQKAELVKILNTARQLNMNGIILQVRPACDALYASPIEPWSEYLTGALGKAPEPYYDPLEFAVEEAHRRGIELHTWFNPYRAYHPTTKSEIPPNHVSRTRPELVKKYGRYLWLNPADPAVQDYSLRVMMDVVRRYDIDGVHMDDYFYPYQERDDQGNIIQFPDEETYQQYLAAGGRLGRDDWRRMNINKFVERLYQEVKAEKPWVKVGISPFGIWRPGHPEGIRGLDAYSTLYADSKLWLEEGWVDYFTPQLYWPIEQSGQEYDKLLTWWTENNPMNRHIWPGNATYKVAPSEGAEGWPVEEILNQIQITRDLPGAGGNVLYNANSIYNNRGGLADALKAGPYNEQALVPALPWLNPETPPAPKLTVVREGSSGDLMTAFGAPPGTEVWQWILYVKQNGQWSSTILPAHQMHSWTHRIRKADAPEKIGISYVNRLGQESPRAVEEL